MNIIISKTTPASDLRMGTNKMVFQKPKLWPFFIKRKAFGSIKILVLIIALCSITLKASAYSDTNLDAGLTSTLLANGDSLQNSLAEIFMPGSLGNFVWEDLNYNGIQDTGEPGISNVLVVLAGLDGSGNLVFLTETTDANGIYVFDNLVPGNYTLDFIKPADYESTVVNDPQNNGNDSNDSDADPANGLTASTNLELGEIDLSWDAGFYQTGSIGNLAFIDANANGVFDLGEQGISGLAVSLSGVDNQGNIVDANTLTDANGNYLFDDLDPGSYSVTFDSPVGFIASTSLIFSVEIESGEQILSADAGFYELASIGNFVWDDIDGNGIQDFGEIGIENLTVTLTGTDAFGQVVSLSTQTDANGNYLFEDLVPGNYELTFQNPTGYSASIINNLVGGNLADSDIDPITLMTASTFLESGETDLSWDAGFNKFARIGNYVWEDMNYDGLQGTDEPPIAGVQVTLFQANGNPVTTVATDADGFFLFELVPTGDYYLIFTAPLGYMGTLPFQGSDNAVNSDANPVTGVTPVTTLNSGENDITWDAGFYRNASIGDRVWEDLNGNGIQDQGEPGYLGANLFLLNEDGIVVTFQYVDINGNYRFENLTPGIYSISFELPPNSTASPYNDPDNIGNDQIDSDANPANFYISAPVFIESGEDVSHIDGGFYDAPSIGDRVWEDINGNGIQDIGEPGLEGVVVTLLDDDGLQINQMTTLSDGSYLFDDLVPGQYQLDFVATPNYISSPLDRGNNDLLDSDANPFLGGLTIPTTLISAEEDLSWDAGFFEYATIGDYVWLDEDADGVQDPGEPGIGGVTLTLTGTDGAGNPLNLSTISNPDGSYLFADVPPGLNYTITIANPVGYFLTQTGAGNLNTDSNFDPNTLATTIAVVESGDDIANIDAGLYQLASIGDYVWIDDNKNGIQDLGELPLEGVEVVLHFANGFVVSTTSTDEDGLYEFVNLIPGDYYVQFNIPAEFEITDQNAGINDAIDSDINPVTGLTQVTALESGENDTRWDAGFFQLASIGDYVWEDLNADGIQNIGEPGLQGVTVILLDENDAFVASLLGGPAGEYLFEDLEPGIYSVQFGQPLGLETTLYNDPNGIGNDSNDSDANPANNLISDPIILGSGEDVTNVDAGFYGLSSIGDYVWEDLNYNGIQDFGEPSIQGALVTLLDENGLQVAQTSTLANGSYSFDDLIPGNYRLVFGTPSGYIATSQDQGGNDANDSDANPALGGTTIFTALNSGENDLTWDAGFYQAATIGDYVWVDEDADGVQDPGEPGIGGVTLTLSGIDGAGNSVNLTTISNSNGSYLFTDVPPGLNYTITISSPVGYFLTQTGAGDLNTDSNFDPNTMTANIAEVESGDNIANIDAGLYQLSSIGDYVWIDDNKNGIQDLGELPVEAVEVVLHFANGFVVSTTLTDEDGLYEFENLIPGDYYVQFNIPAGFEITDQNAGINDAVDSDIDPVTGLTQVTSLESGENDPTWDAGLYEVSSVGNFVWIDMNANGIQETEEPGLPGVRVNLLDESGMEIANMLTGLLGEYSFNDLAPGIYSVQFEQPVGLETTPYNDPNGIGNDANDSDANPANNLTSDPINLGSGEVISNIDAGFYGLASIGDYVWEDLDYNGIQDLGEPTIEGALVTLLNQNGQQVGQTSTLADGSYSFDNLVPGNYRLVFGAPTSYIATSQDQGGDDANDSDANPVLGGTTVFTALNSGENDLTWDAGFYQAATIGDYVWVDEDADGIQDPGEPGIGGVTLTLSGTDGAGNPVNLTSISNPDGSYLFVDVPPGMNYTITISNPIGYFPTQAGVGDNETDSNFDPVTLITSIAAIESGDNISNIDAGFYQLASIGDYVWVDDNKNGIQDLGELPLEGVEVVLHLADGFVVETTFTDADGLYGFDNLIPDDYYVQFNIPIGYDITELDVGVNDALDSDIDPVTGLTQVTSLESGENDANWDAGLFQLASIGDYVWEDLNADGIQDAGETGMSGVNVNLLDENGVIINAMLTGPLGEYLFAGLNPGIYYVQFTQPIGFVPTGFNDPSGIGNDNNDSDANPANNLTSDLIELESGESVTNVDAGFYGLASIGDYVWEDLNGDGIQTIGEPPIENVAVTLLDGNGLQVAQTITLVDGTYQFVNLIPGEYSLIFGLPTDYVATPLNQGGNDATDSDANGILGGATNNFTLVSGENDPTWDAGFYRPATIGDFVWNDVDADGVQDAGEQGIGNVILNLSGTDGAGNPLNLTTTSNPDGSYLFEDLPPGENYSISVSVPLGYELTQTGAGNTANDSDFDPTTLTTTIATLVSDENITNIDAGFYEPANIGNYVWLDADNDGFQDPTEVGIGGVTVILYDVNGAVAATTATDPNGFYEFTGLVPGDYQVEFVSPAGLMPTMQNEPGISDAADSDVDPFTGLSQVITLASGESNQSIDAGFFGLASCGDTVFEDLDGNGVQDPGEPGMAGVQITLNGLDADGNVFQFTDVTDANGKYGFDNLVPGTYNIEFEQLTGYLPTAANDPNNNGDDTNDSDMNPLTLMIPNFVLQSGNNDLTLDAGFLQPASIGNVVFEDTNFNGVQDPGEPGIAGITVTLEGTNGIGNLISLTQVTDENGLFLFDNLQPGNYNLIFDRPDGYLGTVLDDPNSNGSNSNDSDADPFTGQTVAITLTSGEIDLTWGAGFYEPASLGDFVWDDLDADGIQDLGEPGIEGVQVTISGFDGQGIPVFLNTITDQLGAYEFTGLNPGNYELAFPTPFGFFNSPTGAGNDANDSDGISPTVTLNSGENNSSIDVGFFDVELNISDVVVNCSPTSCTESQIQIDAQVDWRNATGEIEVSFNGDVVSVDAATSSNPTTVSFGAAADGSTSLMLIANYVSLSISDTVFVDLAPCDCENAAVLIDGFTEASDQVFLTSTGSDFKTYQTGAVLGGERDVETFLTVAENPLSVYTVGVANLGLFAYAEGGDVRGGFKLTYDGVDGDAFAIDHVGLGGINLTGEAGVVDIFTISLQSDLAMSIDFDVYTDAGNASSYSLNVDGINSPIGYQFAFADFVPTIGTGADFSNVGAIQITVNTTGTQGGLDMSLFDFSIACSSCQEPPLAGDDKVLAFINEEALVDVLSNDIDPSGGSLTVALETAPTNGTVVQVGQAFLYTPDEDYVGGDSFTYRLTNTDGNADIGTVDISIASCDNQIVIDLFEIGSPYEVLVNIGSEYNIDADASIIGGERDLETFMVVEDPNFYLYTYGDAQDGEFQYVETGPVRGGFNLVYDGSDGDASVLNPTGLGGIDLTAGGTQSALQFFLKADSPSSLDIEIYTDGGNMSRYTLAIPGSVGKQLHIIEYSEFVATLGAGVNFTNVGAITVRFNSNPFNGNRDLSLLCITTGCKLFLPDNDEDGVFDINDPDDDNDGIADWEEAGCASPATFGTVLCPDPAQDHDGDGIPNYQDADLCTLNAFGVCADQDTDNDGTPDFFDVDADNDCIPDYLEASNSAPSDLDTDEDGIDNAFDLDEGGPGLNVNPEDTDGDGTPDYQDLDTDNDGLMDFIEANNLQAYGIDTDMDGIDDVCDPDQGGPGLNQDPLDTDEDGIADFRDDDSDGDGIKDNVESMCPLPANPQNLCDAADTDEDGTPDHLDLDSDNDGIPDAYECPVGIDCIDTDADGTPDYLDTDADGDSIPDEIESLCDTPFDANVLCDPIDTDSDGTPDHLDMDADNDGLLDGEECPFYDGIVSSCDENENGIADHLDCRSSGILINAPTQICPGDDWELTVVSEIPDALFEWRLAGTNQVIQITNEPIFQGLTADATYEVTLLSNFCISEAVQTVSVDVVDPIALTISTSSLECIGMASDVELFLDVVGGSGLGFQYSWTGPNGFTSFMKDPVILNADAATNNGNYQVEVTDVLGCVANATVQINISEIPDAPGILSSSPICLGDMVQLSTPTIPGASYSWYDVDPNLNPSAIPVFTTPNPMVQNLATGAHDYFLIVEIGGCESLVGTSTVTVNAAPEVENLSGFESYCSGDLVILSAENNVAGTGDIAYTWTGPNGFSFTGNVEEGEPFDLVFSSAAENQSGTYSLSVQSENGCVSNIVSANLIVEAVPETPILTVNSDFICEGDELVLSTTPLSGTSVEYRWFNSAASPIDLGSTTVPTYIIPEVEIIDLGVYYVIAVVNGCPSVQSNIQAVEVFELPAQVVAQNTTSATSPACEGMNVELEVPIISGATYQWYGPNGFTSDLPNPVIPGATIDDSGEYFAVISYNDCHEAETIATEVFVQETALAPTINAVESVCVNSDATLEVTSELNYPPGTELSFEWYNATTNELVATTTDPALTFDNVSYEQGGEYYVILTVGDGMCTSDPSAFTLLEVYDIPEEAALVFDESIYNCGEDIIELEALTPEEGTGIWTTVSGSTISNPNMPISFVDDLEPGANEFVWSLSNGSCQNYSSDTVVIYNEVAPEVQSSDMYVALNNSIENYDLMDFIDVGNIEEWEINVVEYAEHGVFEGVEDGMVKYEADADYFGPDEIIYEVCNINCPDLCVQGRINVTVAGVDQDGACKITNILTPNNDGSNDHFKITCIEEYPNNEVVIFNRWGDRIYGATSYQNDWNGTYKGADLPAGTYFYVYKLKPEDDVKSGFFTIAR